jgi:hypothetical protein
MIDFEVRDHGSVVGFIALTERAIEEMEYMELEGWQKLGTRTFYVDHRIAGNLVNSLLDNGFAVN